MNIRIYGNLNWDASRMLNWRSVFAEAPNLFSAKHDKFHWLFKKISKRLMKKELQKELGNLSVSMIMVHQLFRSKRLFAQDKRNLRFEFAEIIQLQPTNN